MDQSPLFQFLKNILQLPEQKLEEAASCFEKRAFKKNEFFLETGKVSNEYLFLTEGAMRAFVLDTNGDEVTTGLYIQNRVVLEVASFFLRLPSQENIQALTNSTGYAITYENLNRLFHTIPEFRENGRGILVRELAFFKQRTLGLINQTADERYEQLIRQSPEIFQFVPLKYIASYLGITDTSLSRIRREFSKK